MTWICRGWPEGLEPMPDVPHQGMHAYHEVGDGQQCDICHAAELDLDRWDGVSDPFVERAALDPKQPTRNGEGHG